MPNRLSRLLKLVGSYLVSSIQGICRVVVIIISLIVCLPCFLGCILIVLMLGMIPFFLMWKYGNIPQDETSMLISAIIYIAPFLIVSILNLIIYTLVTFFEKREVRFFRRLLLMETDIGILLLKL